MSASPQAFHQYYENVSFRLLQRVSELWNPQTACVDCLLHKHPGANPILSTLEGAESLTSVSAGLPTVKQ